MSEDHTPPPTKLERRVTELEVFRAETKVRMSQGAESMARHLTLIDEVRSQIKPVPARVWLMPTLGLLITLGGSALTLAWHAGRVPDRDEISALRQQLHDLEVRQARLDQTLQSLDSGMRRIEESQRAVVDLLNAQGRKRR